MNLSIDKIKFLCKDNLHKDYLNQIVKFENMLRKKKALEPVANVIECKAFFELFAMYILFDEVYSELQDMIWENLDNEELE